MYPHPRPPNPHIISALLLQAIFLGASALGLLGRKKAEDATSDRFRGNPDARRREEELDELTALNLFLSSYVPTSGTPPSPTYDLVRPISTILTRLNSLPPSRWTILALLAFVDSPLPARVAGPVQPLRERNKLSRPILLLWAWKSFVSLPSPSSDTETDHAILAAFTSFISTPPRPVAEEVHSEILEGLATRHFDHEPLPNTLRLALGQAALESEILYVVMRLLREDGPGKLEAMEKIFLASELLKQVQRSEQWRGEREAVLSIAQAFSDAVADLLEESGSEGLERKAVKSVQIGTQALMAGYGIDVPLESFITTPLVALLRASPSSASHFSAPFLLSVLHHLSNSRHPKLALFLFEAIPAPLLTLRHFDPLLRTHHSPTSDLIWAALLAHPNFVPDLTSYSSRLSSHAKPSNLRLEAAHDDLRRMGQAGIERTTKEWNKLLKLVVRLGSDRMVHRQVRKLVESGIERDGATFNTVLQRSVVSPGRVGARKEGVTKGRKQMELVRTNVRLLAAREKRRRGHAGIAREGDEVTSNVVLKVATRWSIEVNAGDLVRLARRVLGVDLEKGEGWEERVESTLEGWEERRRPAYQTLLKAFVNRGETQLRSVLLRAQGAEKRRTRELVRAREELNPKGPE